MKKSRSIIICICIVIGVALFSLPNQSYSQIPKTISYQGYLTDKTTGDPINNSAVAMIFSIYDVSTGGTALWSQTQDVNVTQGIYNVVLGGGTTPKPINLTFNKQYYLGIKVGTGNEMSPRQSLTSVPYALNGFNVEDRCFSLLHTADQDGPEPTEGDPILMRLGLTKVGEAYYLIHGYIEIPNDNPFIMTGSGFIINNELLITGTGSQEHNMVPDGVDPEDPFLVDRDRDSSILHFSLDAVNLNGTFWANGLQFDPNTRDIVHYYSAGTVTSGACP